MILSNETCPAELPNWCAQRHWSIFWILIVASVAVLAGRVCTIGYGTGKLSKPFYSANDRSRWATIRSLGDHGTFELDEVLASENGKEWDTIDKVRTVGRDGNFHYYSSKPPLISVAGAGVYRLLKSTTGLNLETDTLAVVRILLIVFNVIPWGIYLWFVARMINSVPVRDWARYYILGCACFATYLLPFGITLNNHLPAAVCVMIALYCVSEIIRKKSHLSRHFFAAGLFGGFAVAFELPALSFLGLAGLVCFTQSVRKTLMAFVPPVLIVSGLILAINSMAFGQLKPAYNQRQDGPEIFRLRGDYDEKLNRGELPVEIQNQLATVRFSEPAVEQGAWPSTPRNIKRWVVRDRNWKSTAQVAIVRDEKSDSPDESHSSEYRVLAWGNWYDYPGSYWLTSNNRKSAIDQGQSSQSIYAFHLLFGHHGIFSLTPIWLFSFAGMFALLMGAKMGGAYQMRWLGAVGIVLSLVVFAFYIKRPEMDRNYGGYCCTARWFLWLVPIWSMCMLPVVDWFGGSRRGKFVCFLLMFLSVVSASIPSNNPWVLPWLYEIWDYTGLPT